MSLEIILHNKDYRLLFLKAIILGINYGQRSNANYYLENIEKEIKKIDSEKTDPEKDINPIEKNIKLIEKTEEVMTNKYDTIIINLENQKKYIINYIQTLSKNYSYNYSKINLLKNNLVILNQEIDKNKFKKNKELNIGMPNVNQSRPKFPPMYRQNNNFRFR